MQTPHLPSTSHSQSRRRTPRSTISSLTISGCEVTSSSIFVNDCLPILDLTPLKVELSLTTVKQIGNRSAPSQHKPSASQCKEFVSHVHKTISSLACMCPFTSLGHKFNCEADNILQVPNSLALLANLFNIDTKYGSDIVQLHKYFSHFTHDHDDVKNFDIADPTEYNPLNARVSPKGRNFFFMTSPFRQTNALRNAIALSKDSSNSLTFSLGCVTCQRLKNRRPGMESRSSSILILPCSFSCLLLLLLLSSFFFLL